VKRNAYGGLVGKPKRRRPLGRPRHRLEDVGVDVNTGNTDFFASLEAPVQSV